MKKGVAKNIKKMKRKKNGIFNYYMEVHEESIEV